MKLLIPSAVSVPYQIVERIEAANPAIAAVNIEDAIVQVLSRGADQPLDAASITLDAAAIAALADLLPLGSTRTAATLVAGVQRLAEIRIGQVKVPFTTGQQDELKERAKRSGKSVQQETEAVVRGMHDQFFNQPLGA